MNPESLPNTKLTLEELLTNYGEVLVTAHGKIMKLSETPEKCSPFINALLQAENADMQKKIIELYEVTES